MPNYPEFEYPKKKYSLYSPKTGKTCGIKIKYGEGLPTICGENQVLANMIKDLVEDEKVKDMLLRKVDVVYDMGKRMGDKLAYYHNKYKKKHSLSNGWRDGF